MLKTENKLKNLIKLNQVINGKEKWKIKGVENEFIDKKNYILLQSLENNDTNVDENTVFAIYSQNNLHKNQVLQLYQVW